VAEGTWNCCTSGEHIHEQNRMNMIDGAKCHRRRTCTYRITINSCASGRYYNILHKTITSSRLRYTTRSEYCGNMLLCIFTVTSCCINMRLQSSNIIHTRRLEVCRHVVVQVKSYLLQMVLLPCYALLAWSEGQNRITYVNVFYLLFQPRRFCRGNTWMP